MKYIIALSGLGLAMIIVSALVAIYYAVIIAYCLYFLVASMQSEVPWKYCDNNWNTCDCRDGNQNDSLIDPWNGTRPECLNMTYTHTKSASDEYFNHKVLEKTSGMDDMQGVKWTLTLCNLFVWLLTFIVLSRGIKSLGKVVYFSATFPYILLTALLIRGLLLEGHMEGITFYLTPDWSKLTEASVWSDAAVQIFYSLGTCQGGLIAMASYNQFKNNTLRDSLLIPVINCLTSFYAGFVIFSVLGFMAHKKNTSVDQVVDEGPGLAFVVYPEALAQMPISPLWAVLFFIMMMTLGFSSLFSITETVITGLVDQMGDFVQESSRRLYIFRFCICALFFLLGLPMTTKGGMYMLNLLDKSVGGFLCWQRKPKEHNVINDDESSGSFDANSSDKVVIVLKALQWKPYTLDDYVYPDWATALSWLIVAFPIVFIPAWILYYCACRDKRNLCHPKANWGPAFEENRTGLYSKDLTSFYQSPVASTVLEKDGYQFIRKDTNEVNKTHIYQPYSEPPVMATFESRTDSSYDNKSYIHDVVESTKL
ncbi:GLYT [Mytilus edulis]|uniref:SLC6A5_9 n=1 Tax=Mytilus edulis TaxID=6550 RepID=A0A8S3S0L1_MYTED|nr:GLYT [Mytilus edulis]